ncbi:type II secretion system F family protein [Pantoea sp. DY-5]|uniref:type II secretion system F family protein n=1 Tax=Pantoea sp. DY-5 TaxID=2871488 RepID=UPI001C9867E0|nr:type II secretion system F family protein [Pantoea sp. DY-5]MBY4841134.1 type II secretion system F family protein [Pantoea sp. DY-5]
MAEFIRVLLERIRALLKKGSATSEELGRWIGQKTFSTSDRTTLYEDLAFLLESNQKTEDAIAGMQRSRRRKNDPMLLCLSDVRRALTRGRGIEAGLAGWVPPQETTILRAGRAAKDLQGALHRAIFVVKGMGEMKSITISNLSYPALLLGSTFYMMKMVYERFLPQLERMVPVENWTGALWWLGSLTHFFIDNRYLLAVALAVFSGWVIWSLPRLTGPARKRVLDRLFPWSLYREMQGVSFLLNLSALLRANVRTDEALDMLSRNATPWLYERLTAAKRQVARGKHLGLALADSGYVFPSRDAIDRLSLLTASPGGEDNIENFARMWLTKTIERIKRTTRLLQVAGMLICAGYLLLTFIATQNLSDLIGNH